MNLNTKVESTMAKINTIAKLSIDGMIIDAQDTATAAYVGVVGFLPGLPPVSDVVNATQAVPRKAVRVVFVNGGKASGVLVCVCGTPTKIDRTLRLWLGNLAGLRKQANAADDDVKQAASDTLASVPDCLQFENLSTITVDDDGIPAWYPKDTGGNTKSNGGIALDM